MRTIQVIGKPIHVLVAVTAVFFVACLGDPYLSSYTSTKPDEANIAGTWVPDDKSLSEMRDRGGYDTSKATPMLILRVNGEFEMREMPDWWRDPFGESHKKFHSSSGTWKVKQHGTKDWWELGLYSDIWGGANVQLRGEKPPYLIHFTLGDPDIGDAMVFVRKDG